MWNFEPDPKYADLFLPVLAYADLLATRDDRNIEAPNLIYEQHISVVEVRGRERGRQVMA